MNRLLKIIRFLMRIRRSQDHSETIGGIFRNVLPDFSHSGEALKQVSETALYIGYEAGSILRNYEDIKRDVSKVEYEMKGVRRSINHYFPKLAEKKS